MAIAPGRRDAPSLSVARFLKSLAFIGIPLILFEAFIVVQFRAGSLLHNAEHVATGENQPTSLREQFTTPIARKADAYFSGYPIYIRNQTAPPPHSKIHCTGETYRPPFRSGKEVVDDSAWIHRSCQFLDLFCLDLDTRDYVLYAGDGKSEFRHHDDSLKDISASHLLNHTRTHNNTKKFKFGVSLGSVNTKWGWKDHGVPRIKWFPTIRHTAPPSTYYELDDKVILIPYHSLSAFNPGHLVWDDFLPLYTLLAIFGLEKKEQWQPLLLRHRFVERGLWATCDFKSDRFEVCKHMLKKFGPLMLHSNGTRIETHLYANITATRDDPLDVHPQPKSNLICAKRGAAGIGALSDHGTRKGHGWEPNDYTISYNDGRGGAMWRFRNHMVANLASYYSDGNLRSTFHRRPHRIVFSAASSRASTRNLDFGKHVEILEKSLDESYATVETHIFSKYPLQEQVQIASQASVYITMCGGGAVTGMFLPKGATLILLYIEDGGVVSNRYTKKPARLDWDLFNHMSYLRVHWFPKQTMDTKRDLNAFLEAIRYNLKLLDQDRTTKSEWMKKKKPNPIRAK